MVQCDFCPRRCQLEEGESGFCAIRINRKGVIETVNYGHPVSASVDSIEKKPLYHFYPGENTLSIALFGCNFHCKFCQNYRITQPSALESGLSAAYIKGGFGEKVSAEETAAALKNKGLRILSYTYSEPVVWQDYMIDCAHAVHENQGLNVMVTNGSLSDKGRERVIPVIDAFNIDLKGGDSFYKEYCDGFRNPVLDTIERVAADTSKVLEVSTLVIEGVHSVSEIVQQGEFLVDAGVKVWHLSRFFPHYQMKEQKATSERFLAEVMQAVSSLKIPHIYNGNSQAKAGHLTKCSHCGELLISRKPFFSQVEGVEENLQSGRCIHCHTKLYGAF